MTQAEKKEIKHQIRRELTVLDEQIALLTEKAKPIAPDCSLGRLTRIEAMNKQEINRRILEESRLRQTRLRNALGRIDSEGFGICIECEEAIGMARMRVRPESIRCVGCANGTS